MDKRTYMLENEKISKLLLKLSLPATIGMIVNALYNIVDTIFIGRGVGKLGIAGLTISFPIQMIMMAFSLMIGIGAASAVSRSLGAKNKERADYVAGNAIFVISIISVLIVLFGYIFMKPLLLIFGATENILPYSIEYMRIIYIGSLYFPLVMTANNLARAEGNAKVSMFSMIIGTGLNIVLDPIFIFGFKMGISGAALATIISQFVSFVYLLRYFLSGKSSIDIKLKYFKPKFDIIFEIISVGFPSFARNIVGSIVAIIINNSIKAYSPTINVADTYIAILGIVNRVIMFLFMPLFGVIQGMQPIVGYNYGAKKYDRVIETVKISIYATFILSSFGFILGELFPKQIINLFDNDSALIENGSSVLRIIISMVPIIGIQIVGGALYQALGKAIPSLIVSLLRQVFLFIPFVIILPMILSNKLLGVWLSYPLSDLICTIITGILLKRELKKLKLDNKGEI